jgi:orotate phosphoribosyltransferase
MTFSESELQHLGGVGGLTLGADPIATSISLAAREAGFFLPAFIVRKEAKKHGTSQFIEGIENLKPGCEVLIVEDVVTTGASSVVAIERMRDAGFRVNWVLTVVDRIEGGEAALKKIGCKLLPLCTLTEIQSV